MMPYQMPEIHVGDPVQWRYSPNGEPAAAIVTHVGRHAVSVMVFPPESRVGVPKEGVRHSSDPQLPKLAQNDGGVWDYTRLHRLIVGLTTPLVSGAVESNPDAE